MASVGILPDRKLRRARVSRICLRKRRELGRSSKIRTYSHHGLHAQNQQTRLEALHRACPRSFGSWLSGGHFVSGEEQVIVSKGLLALKRWARTWVPRYLIIDLSSIEENAVSHAFPGLQQASKRSAYSTAPSIAERPSSETCKATARAAT